MMTNMIEYYVFFFHSACHIKIQHNLHNLKTKCALLGFLFMHNTISEII